MFGVSVTLLLALQCCLVSAELKPYDYYTMPSEWPAKCFSGMTQSPINIDSAAAQQNPLPANKAVTVQMPTVNQPMIINQGNVLQVEWAPITAGANAMLPEVPIAGNAITDILTGNMQPTKTVSVTPLQFHFHSYSEHIIDGSYAAAEVHIVSHISEGEMPEWGCDAPFNDGEPNFTNCTIVFGILFKDDGSPSPPWLNQLFNNAPKKYEGKVPFGQTFDMSNLLPESTDHYEYLGSLTTPPCAEGLRWIVMSETLPITSNTTEAMHLWLEGTQYGGGPANSNVLTDNRLPQPLNDREVFYAGSAMAGGMPSSAMPPPAASGQETGSAEAATGASPLAAAQLGAKALASLAALAALALA